MARAKKPVKKGKPAKPKAKPKAKAKAKARPKGKPKAPRKRVKQVKRPAVAVPTPVVPPVDTGRRRALTARERAGRASPVVEILDDDHPIGALRRFLEGIKGHASEPQAQIALGAAQLLLLPIAREHRGGPEVKELLDLVVQRWSDFGERGHGFHAQEFLRNAFAAVGVDRERIARLEALVPPSAGSELLFGVACAHAVARDKVAMLRTVAAALAAGATSAEFRRDHDFAPYTGDPDLAALLARADVPAIPVDVEPYVAGVRGALDSLVGTLRELGERAELRPPVRLDAILDAERARKISLPNDYRALLTITNGMKVWGHEFFGAGDYREMTPLAQRAEHYLHAAGKQDCVPVAAWAQPTEWLVYDPRGRARRGVPGYLILHDADEQPVGDLVNALARLEAIASDVLGTN